jgi:hypothetical protein
LLLFGLLAHKSKQILALGKKVARTQLLRQGSILSTKKEFLLKKYRKFEKHLFLLESEKLSDIFFKSSSLLAVLKCSL